ncbi:acetylcholine receptor subunit alpha-like [Chrysoperla carnea]|uniref:acetylcholine receptor subunit alpha-like n=1 Tax=Chrysoperla carnea TaxID=189513 RepID=UPI001D085F93|nr:acetylcholine receptor subunit alpha-like [Chrysoperla carnea]
MISLCIFVLILLFNPINGESKKNNSIKIDYTTCKKLITNHGYGYKNFYEITELENHSPRYILDLHFAVQAARDAHILLTPSPDVTINDPVYEIVLGGGLNTFTDIRRQKHRNTKTTAQTKNLLSRHELRPFWLRVSTDGLIQMGNEGEELAFVSWKDPDPLPIRYVSFGTWTNVEAEWMFDCKLPVSNYTEEGSILLDVPKNIPTAQKLYNDLFNEYDPYVMPQFVNEPLILLLNFKRPRILNINEQKSMIRLQAIGDLKWHDSKLKWTPSTYDNITFIKLKNRNIWLPEIHLYNSLRSKDGNVLEKGNIIIWNDGLVQWNPNVNLEVKANEPNLLEWPNDKMKFQFVLGLWSDGLNATISPNSSFSTKMEQELLEWKIVNYSYQHFTDIITPWVYISDGLFNDTSALLLTIEIQRINPVLGYVYHSIYLIVAASIMLTFCVSSENYAKIGLICFQFLLFTLVLISILMRMPPESKTLPKIVQFCCCGMLLSTFLLVITILIIHIIRNEHTQPLPKFICNLLAYQPVQMIFLLPNLRNFKTYGQFSQKEQTENNCMDINDLWNSFGLLLDRIMFILYSFLVSFLFIHYF